MSAPSVNATKAPLKWSVLLAIATISLLVGLVSGMVGEYWGESATPAVPTSADVGPSVVPVSKSPDPALRTIELYYAGRKDGKLFREYHELTDSKSQIDLAITALLDVPPKDPDYVSMWAPGKLLNFSFDGQIAIVDLSKEAFADIETASDLEIGINQIKHTLAANLATAPEKIDVEVRQEGDDPTVQSGGYGEATEEENMLADLWITSIENQATVAPGPVRIDFQTKNLTGPAQLEINDEARQKKLFKISPKPVGKRDPWVLWREEFDLKPGTYEVVVKVGEGASQVSENKVFVVRED